MYEFLMSVSNFTSHHPGLSVCVIGSLPIFCFYLWFLLTANSERKKMETKYFGECISGRLDEEKTYLQKLIVGKLFALKNKVINTNEELELINEEIDKIKESEGYKSLTPVAILEKTIQFEKLSNDAEKAEENFKTAAEIAFKAGFVHEAAIMGYGDAEDELEYGKSI
ncbi:MAG: hypothetical protein WAV11_02785 [Minisyncoccia bacterium]